MKHWVRYSLIILAVLSSGCTTWVTLKTNPPGATAELTWRGRDSFYCPSTLLTPVTVEIRHDVNCQVTFSKPGYISAKTQTGSGGFHEVIEVTLTPKPLVYLKNTSNGFPKCSTEYFRDFGEDVKACRVQARNLNAEGKIGVIDGEGKAYANGPDRHDQTFWDACMLAEGWIPTNYTVVSEEQPCLDPLTNSYERNP